MHQLLSFTTLFFLGFAFASTDGQVYLAESALSDVLTRGAPILGYDQGCSMNDPTCDWMSKVPDTKRIVELSLPGTHDAATWNYSDATQQSLIRYTGPIAEAKFFRCQEHSLFHMLNRGVRVFDLRFALNPGNDTIGFYHGRALLSPTTRMEDVFFGFYSWLDKHPTEAVLISLNIEGGTGTQNTEFLQQHVYDILQSDLARSYWVQANGTLGTLGEARGKLTLIQRFNYSLLPLSSSNRIGIRLGSEQWTDNGANIEIVYNREQNQRAYIEDYYEIGLPTGASTEEVVQWKFNATTAHIENAMNSNPDQLYISFASGFLNSNEPPQTPIIMALGNGTDTPGMNQKLLPWLQERKGSRFGVIMLDFFDSVPGLIEAIIGA